MLMSYLPFFFFNFFKRLTYGSEHAVALKIPIYFKTGTVATNDTVNTVYLQFPRITASPSLVTQALPAACSSLTVVQLSSDLGDFC